MTPTRPSELLRIRVVRRSGSLIGPARAALRFAVLTIPWTLNGATFGLDIALPAPLQVVADGLVALIVFGGTLSSLYLFVFNRRTRQSLHDLVADTFVVDAHAAAPPAGRVSRVHLGIVGAICVAAMVLPLAMIKWVATDAAAMKTLWQTVQSTPGVGSAIVSAVNVSPSSTAGPTASRQRRTGSPTRC
jgi:ABC-type dipeptide/oligopeptide/nickel transport system permease component